MTDSSSAFNLTDLLDSLHAHLQSQTQLLPELHAQLGLPPGALAEELNVLHQQLMNGVEQQIDARRQQVNEWISKCEDVERHCLGYARALGGNVNATGNSLEELKKEQVLPRRYDLISEHQEKLRQLYQTKLEQLNTLANRLSALATTLGSDFFSREFMEQQFVQDEEANNDGSYRDVTPEKFLKLEKELVRGKAEVSNRLAQLLGAFVQIDWLYTELGITPPSLDDPGTFSFTVPMTSSHSPPSYTNNNDSQEDDPFTISTPTPGARKSSLLFNFNSNPLPSSTSITTPAASSSTSLPSETDYQRIFLSFVDRLEEMADADAQPASVLLRDVDPSPALLSWAAATQSRLEEIKRTREASIQAMYDQLEPLWRRLGVSDEEMDAFVEQHRGSTEQIVRQYEEELARMLELKRESMHAFVASARDEITKLWDELLVGEEERADFAPFFDDEATEELLAIHEDEVRRLKEDRRSKAHLLAAIRKYFDICREERELAAAASDQSRLLGRGPRDPGRLLREEKMRKRVNKEKPRLQQDLLLSIPAWEAESGRKFMVNGESIHEILLQAAGAAAAEQENKRKSQPSRAGSVPPRATTPAANNNPSQGHAAPPATTSSKKPGTVRSAPSGSQNAPNKRMKLMSDPPPSVSKPNTRSQQRGLLASNRKALNGGSRAAGTTARSVSSPHKIGGSSVSRPTPMAAGLRSGTARNRAMSATSTIGTGGSTQRVASTVDTTQQAVKKAARARRESFKPRPSVDGGMAPSTNHNAAAGRFAQGARGLSGLVVKEEEVSS